MPPSRRNPSDKTVVLALLITLCVFVVKKHESAKLMYENSDVGVVEEQGQPCESLVEHEAERAEFIGCVGGNWARQCRTATSLQHSMVLERPVADSPRIRS